MKTRLAGFLFRLVLLVAAVGSLSAGSDTVRRVWRVDGIERETLIHVPEGAAKGGLPVVFVWHGHGGTMEHAARTMGFQRVWPEAIIIYPQGLKTPGQLTDRAGREPGWQGAVGAQDDRDLKFFDAMLADLITEYRIDEHRVYSTGHSNGGGFTYLLWAERGDKLAAIAPSSAVLGRGFERFRPKPVFHLGSPEDPLVKFDWQKRMIDEVMKLNEAGPFKPDAMGYTLYPSEKGADTAVFLHAGGHKFPDAGPELIVKFFKSHPGH